MVGIIFVNIIIILFLLLLLRFKNMQSAFDSLLITFIKHNQNFYQSQRQIQKDYIKNFDILNKQIKDLHDNNEKNLKQTDDQNKEFKQHISNLNNNITSLNTLRQMNSLIINNLKLLDKLVKLIDQRLKK
jgi:hypothetical protein